MAKKKKSEKVRRTIQDLKRAEMDPTMQYRMKQKTSMPGMILGEDRMVIRKFVRQNLQLARQKDNKMTQERLEQNMIKVLQRLKPELRKVMLRQMRTEVKSD